MVPVESALLPEIEVTNQQDGNVKHHLCEAKPVQVPKDVSPRIQEDGFHVEKDENHRHEIKFDGKGLASVPGRLHAALVRELLGAAGPAPADKDRGEQEDAGKNHGENQIQEKRGIRLQLRGVHGRRGIITASRRAVNCERRNPQEEWPTVTITMSASEEPFTTCRRKSA